MQTGATIQELFPTFVLGLDELEVEVLADLVEPRRIPADTGVVAYRESSSELLVVLDGSRGCEDGCCSLGPVCRRRLGAGARSREPEDVVRRRRVARTLGFSSPPDSPEDRVSRRCAPARSGTGACGSPAQAGASARVN